MIFFFFSYICSWCTPRRLDSQGGRVRTFRLLPADSRARNATWLNSPRIRFDRGHWYSISLSVSFFFLLENKDASSLRFDKLHSRMRIKLYVGIGGQLFVPCRETYSLSCLEDHSLGFEWPVTAICTLTLRRTIFRVAHVGYCCSQFAAATSILCLLKFGTDWLTHVCIYDQQTYFMYIRAKSDAKRAVNIY